MKPYPSHDWARLIGVPVEIRKDSEVVRAGVVDDAMPFPAALWLAADASGGRALFTAAEGYEAWIRPQALGGRLCYKMAAAQLHPAPTLGR
ncbi:hypothetical protein [Pseudarthrobacter enclensis]|uniref:Uncharacterized protein n=1 Tax=Pseudarthrobacter enclensis TaxID=993070 RepID=A0ABT9RXH5_9MICC|nr:hypothetical protein [Pseudarthrobacter enclensis]MDP9889450.1 hypothetical protein [Pseudarthrobacter enclensis]